MNCQPSRDHILANGVVKNIHELLEDQEDVVYDLICRWIVLESFKVFSVQFLNICFFISIVIHI